MIFHKICVLGLGYIGLPTASTFATHGLDVVGVDVNPQIVNGLQNGNLHIHEPGLRTLVHAALHSGNLTIHDKPEESDAFIIAVPTPFFEDRHADMRFVVSAAEAIIPYLRPGNLVILESTSPPLTTANLVAPILERSGLQAGTDFHVAYSPERVLPGQILRELIENARVIGGIDPRSAQAGKDLYQIFVKGEIFLTNATTAEMVKLMENTYRDINIAVANEFSRLADRFGVDIWEAIAIANRHPRVKILNPGPGVGGHCISVDPWFLVESAPDITPLIRTARQVNDSQPHFVVELIRRAFQGTLAGKQITVLGLTYKPDVDDFRESPALEVLHLLIAEGAIVQGYDPYHNANSPRNLPMAGSLQDAVQTAEAIVLLVGHKEFHDLVPPALGEMTPARILVDTVNFWQSSIWPDAGFVVHRLGVGNQD
jgi:UDP-N-acetyl-D-mannosaminuronic acid dehydrogenase